MANDEAKNNGMAPEEVELDSSQLKGVSGGTYDERTGECRCNGCHTLMDYMGVEPKGRKVYKCPNCNRTAHIYY